MTDLRRIVQENRRIVYILAAALAINAALYTLVVYPLAQRVASGEQEAGESTRALVAARKTYDSARGTVSLSSTESTSGSAASSPASCSAS